MPLIPKTKTTEIRRLRRDSFTEENGMNLKKLQDFIGLKVNLEFWMKNIPLKKIKLVNTKLLIQFQK